MKTNVYVDGFNLYYGAARKPGCKWLNILALVQRALPTGHQIHRIRYFTAIVRGTPSDPQKPQRQHIFIRALETLPNLTVHKGRFLTNNKKLRLVTPLSDGTDKVWVVKTEEKGSDVNLASYLLYDGFKGDYEAAVIVSNDSDLLGPIEMVKAEFGYHITILNPHENTCATLQNAVDEYRKIQHSTVK